MDDEKLISLVEANALLYDKSSPYFKCNSSKKMIWEDIGKEMHTSGELCKRRWLAIRDRYGREIREPSAKKWYLIDALHFLRPHIISRVLRLSEIEKIDTKDDSSCSIPRPLHSSEIEKIDTKNDSSLCEAIDLFKQRCVENEQKIRNPVLESFGRMVVSLLENMSEAKKTRAMLRIMETAFEVQQEPE